MYITGIHNEQRKALARGHGSRARRLRDVCATFARRLRDVGPPEVGRRGQAPLGSFLTTYPQVVRFY